MAQAMDHANTDCVLQLCTWYAAEAIKKKLIKVGSYPLEIRKELSNLIWGWIKSSTLQELEKDRGALLTKLNEAEGVYNFLILSLLYLIN